MEQNSELAVPVLDSLSSLAVPADLLLEVINTEKSTC